MTALLLGYRDLTSARDRFVHSLGFRQEWESIDDEGRLTRSQVRLGNTVLLLDRPGAHGLKHPHDVGGVTHLVVINIGSNVDEHREAAAAAGLAPEPCAERPWGREYELHDPEGYVFAFIE